MSVQSPRDLDPARRSVVRLNRRVIYLVGAMLIAAFVAGLIAIRAQGTRLNQIDVERRPAAPPRSQPWFEAVPDQTPAPRPIALEQTPPAAPPASPRVPSPDDQEAQRRLRILRAAMSASIPVAAFERGGHDHINHAARGRADSDAGTTAGSGLVVPPDQVQTAAGASAAPVTMPSPAVREDTTMRGWPPEYLRASVRGPVSPYEVKAGTIIPAVMLTAVNSELPGQILGQVRENVYDSDTGEHLLIPQGTRLVGLYDHHIVSGQQRILITWKRLLLPNGSSLSLRDGMPGTDALGAAGFADQVNNHYIRTFGTALLMSVISAGVQLSQIPEFGQNFRGPTAGNVLGAAVGQQFGSVSSESIRRSITLAPTLDIRPGYAFNVMVTQDVVFPGPYQEVTRK